MFIKIDDNLIIHVIHILYVELQETVVFIKYINGTSTEVLAASTEEATSIFNILNEFLVGLGEGK
jgi:hypothetical protein